MANTTPTWPSTSEADLLNTRNVSSNFRIVKLILYVTIFLISATGNSLVCIVILRKREMKTVTNYFILNLAIADLTLTCICIPFDIPVQEMNYAWPYGAFMCRVLYPLQTLTLFASVYTLTALSLSRYWAIVHPLKKQLTTAHAKLIIFVIWLISVIIVSPYVAVSMERKTNNGTPRCEEVWDGGGSGSKVYTVFLFVFQYLLPLSIIACAYSCIGADLRRRARNENRQLQDMQAEETRKIGRMLRVVTTIFGVCVLPTNVMWLWLEFGEADKHYVYFWDLVAICNIITFSNSASNPICYTILSENFRTEFKEFFGKCMHKLPGNPSEMKPLEMHDREEGRRLRSATTSSAL